jgi:hypothetical protein
MTRQQVGHHLAPGECLTTRVANVGADRHRLANRKSRLDGMPTNQRPGVGSEVMNSLEVIVQRITGQPYSTQVAGRLLEKIKYKNKGFNYIKQSLGSLCGQNDICDDCRAIGTVNAVTLLTKGSKSNGSDRKNGPAKKVTACSRPLPQKSEGTQLSIPKIN